MVIGREVASNDSTGTQIGIGPGNSPVDRPRSWLEGIPGVR